MMTPRESLEEIAILINAAMVPEMLPGVSLGYLNAAYSLAMTTAARLRCREGLAELADNQFLGGTAQ